MRPDTRQKREAEIIAAAWAVLDAGGPDALSMQAVARAARASLETLYRWYGDKTGLYTALVADNADRVGAALQAARDGGSDPIETLETAGAALFDMVTGDRAVALNRAAAADPAGGLGTALAQGGRQRVMPQLSLAISALGLPGAPAEMTATFVDLLLGDVQIRRATGSVPAPAPGTGRTRAKRAVAALQRLYPPQPLADDPAAR